jgi:hypothetical protein
MPDSDFVGRTDLLTQILGDVGGPGRTGTFFDIEGIPGIGKTRLLDQLDRLAKETSPAGIVVRIDGGQFEARVSRLGAPTFDEDAELRQFRVLLRGALNSLPSDENIDDVLNYLTDYSAPSQRVRPGYSSSRRSLMPSKPTDFVHDPDDVLTRATAAANHLNENLAATRTRILLLVDDFHLLAGRPLGRWVMRWLAGIRGADIVVMHQAFHGQQDPQMPSRAVQRPLGNLAEEDVEAYLMCHPGIGPEVAEIAQYVWTFTGGYPQALALAADLIKDSKSPEESVRLIRQLAALQGGRATQLEGLVNRIMDTIDDEELRDALYRVCVTRNFDAPLVEKLMDVDERHAQTLIDRLRHYSFVRESTSQHSFLTVSDFVRSLGEKKLGVTQTQVTHAKAAEYYGDLIVKDSADDSDSYESWYRYEQPEFQALERDWLYHLSRLTGNNRQVGRVGIAQIFLDAFWWWGSYIPFPFCEQILADWGDATSVNDEDRAWGRQLRTLYDLYPKGWQKQAPAGQWTKVRLALRYLSDHCRSDGRAETEEADLRHIRGILDLYLVDAARYVDPGDEDIDELLAEAAELFAREDDDWDVAWVEYYRADVALSREQTEQAMTTAAESAERARALDDDELVANSHRVYADAFWLSGRAGPALDAYARAVAHAYRFQVKGVQDEYTDAFQKEMIDRSVERVAELYADGRDEGHAILQSACARIRAFFGPYWSAAGASLPEDVRPEVVKALAEDRRDDVAAMLFPARPTVLGHRGTEYALICGDVTHRMRRELAKPPGEPLPPAEG